jgi:hypothetical protein
MQSKTICIAIAIFSGVAHVSAQVNPSHPTAFQPDQFSYGQAARFAVSAAHVLPTSTSQDITALLTRAEARIVEPMPNTGVATFAFNITSQDEGMAVFKTSLVVIVVELKAS